MNAADCFAYETRAVAWKSKGDLSKVIADCTTAIELGSTFVDLYRIRAYAWAQKKDYDRVVADCNALIRLNPGDTFAYVTRAHAWCDKHEFDKAIADCSAAIRVEPRNVMAYRLRGWARNWRHEYDQAIADLNEAARLAPHDQATESLLAWCQQHYVDLLKTSSDPRTTHTGDASDDFDALATENAKAGNFSDAVRSETTAIAICKNPQKRNEFSARLKLYQEKKPYRETRP
jgi:tetratricopeptide (TPR) repeat protein